MKKAIRALLVSATWHLALAGAAFAVSDIRILPTSLYAPHYLDRVETAPDTERYTVLKGQIARVGFLLLAREAGEVKLDADLAGAQGRSRGDVAISFHRGEPVQVEGNSNNGICTCPVGMLPEQQDSRESRVCAHANPRKASPPGCPTEEGRKAIAARLIRQAPFWLADALIPLPRSSITLQAGRQELVVVEFEVPQQIAAGSYTVHLRATAHGRAIADASKAVDVVDVQLADFPRLEAEHWLSYAPRNLVARPADMPASGTWGPAWWSEDHWSLIAKGARLLRRMGNTTMLVPLFVRNPSEPASTPLIPVRCISGSAAADRGHEGHPGEARPGWRYEFDFTQFRRAIKMFGEMGFRHFAGAHLMVRGGDPPFHVVCDAYETAGAKAPLKTNVVVLPRKHDHESPEDYERRRQAVYVDGFLAAFLGALHKELATLGVENRYYQHIIDENLTGASSEYRAAVALVRKHLPQARTIDAVSMAWDTYPGQIDYPVINIQSYYRGLKASAALRADRANALYYYNTGNPTPDVGPNRGLDEPLINQRVYPWLAIEKQLVGYLYWGTNEYRYPMKPIASRSDDWTPYRGTIGPLPSGSTVPGHPPGNNWFLYPTTSGLTDSLRAAAFYEGLVDHWLFRRAQAACKQRPSVACRSLREISASILKSPDNLNDYSTNPADYDAARRTLAAIVSGQKGGGSEVIDRLRRFERRFR